MRNYDRIEKLKGKDYYTAYGANGETYRIFKRSYGWCAVCINADVKITQYSRCGKNLFEINNWLGGLTK